METSLWASDNHLLAMSSHTVPRPIPAAPKVQTGSNTNSQAANTGDKRFPDSERYRASTAVEDSLPEGEISPSNLHM